MCNKTALLVILRPDRYDRIQKVYRLLWKSQLKLHQHVFKIISFSRQSYGHLPPSLFLELAVSILIWTPHEGHAEIPLWPAWGEGWGSRLFRATGSGRERWDVFRCKVKQKQNWSRESTLQLEKPCSRTLTDMGPRSTCYTKCLALILGPSLVIIWLTIAKNAKHFAFLVEDQMVELFLSLSLSLFLLGEKGLGRGVAWHFRGVVCIFSGTFGKSCWTV